MSSLKDMYRTVLKDTFPDTMTITLGDAVLTYHALDAARWLRD